jgi:hypothetical protein
VTLRRHWPVIVPFALALGIFHAWFASGLLLGDDQFRFSRDQLASYFPWRNAWDPSFVFGVSSGDASPGYPLWAVAGLLTHLGADFAVVERLVWFWPLFFLLVLAPYAFVYRLTHAPWAAAVAAAVFAVNTWTVSLVQRGHIPSLVAYALMPAAAFAWIVLLRRRGPVDAVAFAALLTLQVMYDLRYAYITASACLIIAAVGGIRAIARRRFVSAKSVLVAGMWVATTLIAFNAYWLLPLVAAPAHLPAGYDSLASFVNASQSQSLAHALALFYPFYHYVQGTDPFKPFAVEPAFFVVFVLVVLSSFAARTRWIALALAASAVVGIVLTSGPQSPFGAIDDFAFAHVPGMTLFRDISKFSALVAFAYAALLGLGFARLIGAARVRAGRPARALAATLACLLIAGYAWLMHDAFNPMRLSNFTMTILSQDDRGMQSFLDRQPGYFRTLLYPTWRPELVGTALHPVVSADYLVDSAPADGGLSDFFPPYATLQARLGSPLIPELLAEASVRYVVVDDDPKGVLYVPFAYGVTHAESVAFFRARPWLHEAGRFGGYVIFKVTPTPSPRAFFAASPVSVHGSPPDLVALVGTPGWIGLPAAVLAAGRTDSVARQTFVAGDASDEETVTGNFVTSTAEHVRAWIGALPSDVLAVPFGRARMRSAAELTPSPIPDLPVLPAPSVTVEIKDPRILSAPFAYPPVGAQWRGIVGPAADIEMTNWSGSTLTADVLLSAVFTPDNVRRVVHVTAAGAMQSFAIAGALFGSAPHVPISLRDVRLQPGLNIVHLDVSTREGGRDQPASPDAYSLIFADDVSVGSRGAVDAGLSKTASRTVVRATQSGIDIDARSAFGDAAYGHASFILFPALSIPLARMPTIAVAYESPTGAARLALYAELRRRLDGNRVEFVHALPSASSSDSVDLFAAVQTALARDRTAAQAPRANDDANDYDLVAVRLVIVASRRVKSPTSGDREADFDARIVDARIDVKQMPSDAMPTVRYTDLRRAGISTAGHAARGPRLAHISANGRSPMSSATVDVPVSDSGDARYLVFWLRTSPDVAPTIDLTFAAAGDGKALAVPAAARPSTANAANDPTPETWRKTVPHVVNGDVGQWRRYVIDLDDVKTFRVPDGGAGYSLTGIRIIVHSIGPIASVDLSDLALASPASSALRPTDLRPEQSLVLDGKVIPIESWRRDPLTGRFVGATAPFAVDAGAHRVSVEPALPLRPSSIYVADDTPRASDAGQVRGFMALSPSEYAADVHGGGLLVWPMSFAPGWQAYEIPASDAMPTGFALLDVWRMRSDSVPAANHVAVNGAFNGWYLAPGAAHVVLLYVPEAASEFGALVWLLLSLAVVITAFAVARARP